MARNICALACRPSAYFSVYYYTKCALLKAGCATLEIDMCNIFAKKGHQVFGAKNVISFWAKRVIIFLSSTGR